MCAREGCRERERRRGCQSTRELASVFVQTPATLVCNKGVCEDENKCVEAKRWLLRRPIISSRGEVCFQAEHD